MCNMLFHYLQNGHGHFLRGRFCLRYVLKQDSSLTKRMFLSSAFCWFAVSIKDSNYEAMKSIYCNS